MADNSKQRRDASPGQDGGPIGRDLGEAVYARHARFVWPTSIASSLAQRFAPFTDKRLPLAATVQRRWSVENSSLARWPDFHWLQAFTARSPRNAGSARRAMAQRSTEVSGQVPGHSVLAASNRAHADFAPPAAESTLSPESEVRSAASAVAPTADPPQELGAAPARLVVQDGSTAAHRFSEVSRGTESLAAPVAPTTHADASVSGSALGRPATVYNAPPIIRRSVASGQRGIGPADSTGRHIPESPNEIRETAAQRSSEETPIQPSVSVESGTGSSTTDRVIFDGTDSDSHSLQRHSLAGPSMARGTQAAELHHINPSPSASRSQDAAARQSERTAAQSLQLSPHQAPSQSVTRAAPSQAVSRGHETSHDSLIMTHATAKPQEPTTEPTTLHASAASRSRQVVPDTAARSQTPGQTPPQAVQHASSIPHVAEDATENVTHSSIVVHESHTDAPEAAMLHLNESSSHAPTLPSADRTGESHGAALPSPVLRGNSDLPADRSPVRLQGDSVSPELSSAGSVDTARANVADDSTLQLNNAAHSHTKDPVAALTPGPNIYAARRIHTSGHSPEVTFSMRDGGRSGAFQRSEPTFRSTNAILRFAETATGVESSSRHEISRNTMVPVVVQESAAAGASPAEPLVLSRQAISGYPSHDLSATLSASRIGPAPSSPAASIATQSLGFMHRNPSTMAPPASSYGSGTMPTASLPVARQATADTTLSSTQLPSLPSVATGAANARSFGGTSPDITQLANRVYEVLVRRLASERQRKGS